ncbi:protein NUCLEAR FUSION DEFECTIVE 6, mitochondrial-like isoform X1 [Silene latifolia]|uniref:protein NUCLEAR FUSION DEFECTIVE 6, mitochondrial-like isoform X1 n=1 Tax=Silene latifolia TaxID=37657 RepID=UPI003D771CB6
MATFAARSFLRCTSTARSAATRFGTTPSPKPKSNFFTLPKQNSLSSPRIFRSPVELSCCVESLMPYHTATATALLTSMLAVTPRGFNWTPEDCNDDA